MTHVRLGLRANAGQFTLLVGINAFGNPISSIGFERRHNRALQHFDEASFASALLEDVPPPPAHQAEIVAANRRGRAHQSA